MTVSRRNLTNHPAFKRVRMLSHLLDNAIPIPGTGQRIGIDPLLGLIPGGGDTFGMLLSAYIVIEGIRLKLPRQALSRMVGNLLTDTLLGSVPIAGDLFDVTWKANSRNVRILEAHLEDPTPQKPADRWFVVGVILVLLLLIAATIAIAALVATAIWNLLSGAFAR